MPLILGTNSIKDTGYDVANSLKFNRVSSSSGDSLERTPSSAGNRRTFTFSCWFKLGKIASSTSDFYQLFGQTDASGTSNDGLWIDSNDRFYVFFNSGERRITNQRLRDPSSWYHVVLAIDTTQSTASNRIKLYLNGSEITSFSTNTDPTLNHESGVNNTSTAYIGERINDDFFDGYMAEVVMIDGQQLDPTSFGEFDSDSPNIWKPIDVSGLTFGTNGFYLDFENSGSLGADVSGNGNNFTVNNLTSVDQSTDTCTNNACTWNPLIRSTATFTNGNLTYQAPSSNPVFGSLTTFGVTKGKWYAECKYVSGSNHYGVLGVADEVFATLSDLGSATNTDLGKTGSALGSHPNTCTIAYVINTGAYRNNNNNTSWGSAGGDGDIINIALDRDNRKVYFGVNGTYGNSSNPASGTNGIDLSSLVTGDIYFLGVTNDTGASETVLDFNFGGGFGQTTVSSGNSDANGHGNFEYAVPSGYFAWNSKNLAEFG